MSGHCPKAHGSAHGLALVRRPLRLTREPDAEERSDPSVCASSNTRAVNRASDDRLRATNRRGRNIHQAELVVSARATRASSGRG